MMRVESMMYEPLAAFFEARGLVVLREVTTPEGRADLVAARVCWSAARLRYRMGFVYGLTRTLLLRAWTALPAEGSTSLEALAEGLAVRVAGARAAVRELEALGFVVSKEGVYARRGELPRVLTEVVFCEAKLDDWRRGLGQAYSHRFYADASYLALVHPMPRTLNFELLDERAVGLLSVADGVAEERSAPLQHPALTLTRLQIEERFWVEIVEPRLRPRRCELMTEERCATA